MRRLAFAWTEPWKTNGHAAANRLVWRKMAFGTQEQQWRFAFFLKSGDVRAVKINFRRAPAGGDVNFRQAAVAAGDGDVTGNLEFPQRFGKDDGFHKTREV